MRSEGAGVAQPRPIPGERRVGLLRIDLAVLEPIELEREEQQSGRDRVGPLLHRLKEAADLRVGEIAGVNQRSIAGNAAAALLQPLVSLDRSAERGARQIG